MRHSIHAFIGRGKSGDLYFDLACGNRLRVAGTRDVVENTPIDDGRGGGWCPDCFPERAATQLRDEDGGAVALHPELGDLEGDDGDGAVVTEEREDDTISEEVVEE